MGTCLSLDATEPPSHDVEYAAMESMQRDDVKTGSGAS